MRKFLINLRLTMCTKIQQIILKRHIDRLK